MSITDAFERDACIHIRLRAAEKNVVFPVRLIVVYYIATGNLSRLYASASLSTRARGDDARMGNRNQT